MFTYHFIGIALVIFTAAVSVILYKGAARLQKQIEQERDEPEEL